MMLEEAIRWTEILLAIAFIQGSLEHLVGQKDEKLYFVPRLLLSLSLLSGFESGLVCIALLINTLFILHRFQGPYNGGSDLMAWLIVSCLALIHLVPSTEIQGYILAYLALQLIFSYFKAGWAKVIHAEWRSGRALQDVFAYSIYPVAESLRGLANYPRLCFGVSWLVILLELLFPLCLLNQIVLIVGLGAVFLFHVSNYIFLGLNRFVWVWVAAYPSLIWLQERLQTLTW